jgi:predicted TIM-barrel fold metal-dependent hydrolase
MSSPAAADPATGPIFDAHLHIIDPAFPLMANQGYLPEPFLAADYLKDTRPLGIVGGAVVAGSFHGFDQRHLISALAVLGPSFVGVAQVAPEISDAEISTLAVAGVRAIRFNLQRGDSQSVRYLDALADRVHRVARWHVEIYADAADLVDLLPLLKRLPRLVIDHMGLSRRGWPLLLDLVRAGAWVKASGFGRVDFEIGPALRAIAAINPHALVFGSDLPSTRAPRPFQPADIAMIVQALSPVMARYVLFENALLLYQLPGTSHPASAVEGGSRTARNN